MVFISITAQSRRAHAQHSEKSTAFVESKSFMSSIRHLATRERYSLNLFGFAGEENTKLRAYKDFQDRFSNVENAIWAFDPKLGYTSYFLRDGYGNRVFYDKKGRWLYSLIFYAENKLPRNIRYQVKSNYFDFTITLVQEVQTHEGIEYVVYLEDKSNILIVKLNSSGDMQIIQELTKG
jgi:putative component of toxin-antitoxin plasmid stabilization module